MNRVRLLSDALASQVAAGEVVERPASVVKELIENSIDAGARRIEVAVQRGGLARICVVDDGWGMDRSDALLAVERHATSKIRCKEDLDRIITLGFRGEALPSIASVSRFRLSTRPHGALAGTEVRLDGGRLQEVRDSGDAPGTRIEVRSLFYNVPARRKFLRTEATEFSHVEQQVRVQAVAHPDIAFSLTHGERTVFRLPAADALDERVAGLVGRDLGRRLLPIPGTEEGGIRVWGLVGEPGLGRSTRAMQFVFLNRRPVDSPVLHYALREGYHTALMKGQYPVTFLFIEMDPGAFDVNVHPSKKEVRFRQAGAVRSAIVAAVADALEGARHSRFRTVPVDPAPGGASQTAAGGSMDPAPVRMGGVEPERQRDLIPQREQIALRHDWMEEALARGREEEAPEDSDKEPGPAEARGEGSKAGRDGSEALKAVSGEGNEETALAASDFRILGVLGRLYVLLEGAEGLVLMDQHAAHERVLFEEMRRRMEERGVDTQRLLVPLMLELAPRDLDLVQQNIEVLARLGIGAEPFGGNAVKIDSLPAFLRGEEPQVFINRLLEELKKESRRMSTIRLGEDLVATTVCRQAVKARDLLRPDELGQLLVDLLACEMPFCCPHGRPTLVQISFDELERRFGRRT
ncbi:MAG TPA: DNA mismatch repair endonuclease MutL [Verrucomicrobiales bacterium]|nr:DNA mismatch repair endonuclease MutL [Verrucomicrobiales bacterium]